MSLNSAVRYEAFDESVKALRQDALKDSFFANGDGPWTVIYDEWSVKGRANGGQFIALSQLNMRERVMRDVGWDIRKGEGIPGFVDDGTEVSYFKSGSLPEFEPLVVLQEFFGVVPDEVNISEDFRFLMRLWRDPKSRNYYEIQESGDKELAIRISGEKIEVRTPLLKRYLAARQLDAVLYIDSNVGMDYDGDLANLADIEEEAFSTESLTCFSRYVWKDTSQSGRIWTRFLAKRIIKAPPREK